MSYHLKTTTVPIVFHNAQYVEGVHVINALNTASIHNVKIFSVLLAIIRINIKKELKEMNVIYSDVNSVTKKTFA